MAPRTRSSARSTATCPPAPPKIKLSSIKKEELRTEDERGERNSEEVPMKKIKQEITKTVKQEIASCGLNVETKTTVVNKIKAEVMNRDSDNDIGSISDSSISGSSSSSSSAEDSDDDYELQTGKKKKNMKKSRFHSSTDDSDIEQEHGGLINIESKVERDVKKKRLFQKQRSGAKASDDEGLICEFESSSVLKNRKRRLFRRKMLKTPGEVKRRRIRRANVDVTINYTCDTFASFGITTNKLTKAIDSKDSSINHKKLQKVFAELEIESHDSCGELSDYDEADVISNKLNFYGCRNLKERVNQIAKLDINPFVEKLAGYNGRKAKQGSSHSRIRIYHPEVFVKKNTHKLPEALLWRRPFTHLVYQDAQFDVNKTTSEALHTASIERAAQKRKEMLERFKLRAREKLMNRRYLNPIRMMVEHVSTEIQDESINHPSTSNYMHPEETEILEYTGNCSLDYEEESTEPLCLFDELS